MKLSRSSFYYKPRDKNAGKKADTDLRDRIETICLGFPRYGYRRVTAALKREGKASKPQESAAADAGERPFVPGEAEEGEDYR